MKKKFFFVLIIVIFSIYNVKNIQAVPSVTSILDDNNNPVSGGIFGDTIFVNGEGATSGSEIRLYWDTIKDWDGKEGLINSSIGLPNGNFKISFEVPEAVYGDHYLWFKEIGSPDQVFGPIQFDVNASISTSPKRGLKNDFITINGNGFHGNTNIDTIEFDGSSISTDPSLPQSNLVGSWSATFQVPDISNGEYEIFVSDIIGSSASTLFNVSPVITLDQLNGSAGEIIQVDGRGFTPSGIIISVKMDGIDCGILNPGDLSIDSNGKFTFDLVVPSVTSAENSYSLKVLDNNGMNSSIEFYVTAVSTLQLIPRYGNPGTTVGVYGSHFSKISGKDVVIKFNGNIVLTLDTNSDGEISGVFIVPAVPTGEYLVEAEQVNYNIEVTESFRVAAISVVLTPTNGSTGTPVTLTGTGFTAGGKWNAFFDEIQIFSDMDVNGDTTYFGTFYIPVVDTGEHLVTVIDETENIEVEILYQIINSISLEINPINAPVGYNVTFVGEYFAESSGDIEVDFVIYNSTDAISMDVYENTASVTTGSKGEFNAWWIVPDSFSLGDYLINATDEKGLTYQLPFQVTAGFQEISTIKQVYYRNDPSEARVIRFNIESSFRELDSYIMIFDPTDSALWRTDDFSSIYWLKQEVTFTVPYFFQTSLGSPMVLDDDAPLGNWTWKWFNNEDDLLATGKFLVEEEPVIDDPGSDDNFTAEDIIQLQEEIAYLEDVIEKLTTDLEDALKGINNIANVTSESIHEFNSSIKEVQDDVTESLNKSEEAKVGAETAKQLAEDAKSTSEETLSQANQISDDLDELKNEIEEIKEDTRQVLNSSTILRIIAFVSLLLSVAAAGQSFGFFKITK